MTLDPAMVGRPLTSCKSAEHHQRNKPAADVSRGQSPDRLTSLRLKPAKWTATRTDESARETQSWESRRPRPTGR